MKHEIILCAEVEAFKEHEKAITKLAHASEGP